LAERAHRRLVARDAQSRCALRAARVVAQGMAGTGRPGWDSRRPRLALLRLAHHPPGAQEIRQRVPLSKPFRWRLANHARAVSSSWIPPSPPSNGGEGWGEEARFYWFLFSSLLYLLVPLGVCLVS